MLDYFLSFPVWHPPLKYFIGSPAIKTLLKKLSPLFNKPTDFFLNLPLNISFPTSILITINHERNN